MDIEVLYFDGCPAYERLMPRLRALVADAGQDAETIRLRRVETPEAAEAARFLGSPTVRIDGVDVDPGAGQRDDFGLKCRIYRSADGQSPLPPEAWIRAALRAAATTRRSGAVSSRPAALCSTSPRRTRWAR